jgi:hypothetical protein
MLRQVTDSYRERFVFLLGGSDGEPLFRLPTINHRALRPASEWSRAQIRARSRDWHAWLGWHCA